METIAIQFDLTSNDVHSGLSLEITFNDKLLQTVDATEPTQKIQFGVDCVPGNQLLCFTMKNKTPQHTILDDQGEIVKDSSIGIENFVIDHVSLEHTFYEQCRYNHDFNGSQESIDDDFFGIIGCNGTVSLKFTSPVYRWLVDTM
jgi:hypothetical protein